MKNMFKGKQFDKKVIIEAVGFYCRYYLSGSVAKFSQKLKVHRLPHQCH